MSNDDKTYPLATVTPGARLTAAVFGVDGQVLLTAGTVLTENALATLAASGIAVVAVEPWCGETEGELAHDTPHQRVRYLFRRCNLDDADGVARMLFDAVLAYRQRDRE